MLQSEFAENRITSGRRLMQRLHIDLPLLFGLLILTGIGLFVLYSASSQDSAMIYRQAARLALAFAILFAVAQLSPSTLAFWSPWIYSIGLILLIAVLLLGDVGKGAQRWLDIGIFRFQPSEIMKLAVPMMIARFLADANLPPNRLRLLLGAVLIIVPAFLVAKQPDLGTALLIACAGGFVLFLAGLSWRFIIFSLIAIAASAPFVWNLLREYQQQRILTLLNPQNDPLGTGYHIIQSTIAIGSGGIYGKGWLNGTQSHLDFLPERNTDFIFAVFSEEFGFFGILLLLLIYIFIISRGLIIAIQSQDTYSRLLAGSLALTFFVYLFVNIGMVSGLLPVVGVPLPLVSYGGTSIVTLMAAFGILMSIQTHRKLLAG
jgi:rod shape determining protein RodA